MRLIKMIGGLGNQMFIYAFYLQMKKRFSDVYIDILDMMHYKVHYGYEMNEVFNLPQIEFRMNQPLKKVIEFLFFKTILERKQNGALKPYECTYIWPLIYFKGFYQSEKYFEEVKEDVRKLFTFDLKKANVKSLQVMQQILYEDNSVSLHVRRGDYLNLKHWDSIGCVCQLPYYRNALLKIKSMVSEPVFYVFSDDIEWVKQNLDLDNAIYVDWNNGRDSWQDMMLMSCCRNHIICNSTFSWWGAWLNPHDDKIVIAPEQWSKNIESNTVVPQSWIKVPNK